jgi:glycerophosphoryl diester phosphodiesterase
MHFRYWGFMVMHHPDVSLFLKTPIYHCGLHGKGIPKNTVASVRPAIEKGLPVEVDIVLNREKQWMLGHWPWYKTQSGQLKSVSFSTTQAMQAAHSQESVHHIPSLQDLFTLVKGKIPLLLDVKLFLNPSNKGLTTLTQAVNTYAKEYGTKNVAVQMYHPVMLRALKDLEIQASRGLLLGGVGRYPNLIVPKLDIPSKKVLKFVEPDFVSIHHSNGPRYFDFIRQEVKRPVLAYVIKSPTEKAEIMPHTDNIIQDPFPIQTLTTPEPSASFLNLK